MTSKSRVAVGKRSKSQGQGLNAGPDQNQTATKGLGQGQGEGQPTQLELNDFGRQSGLQPREPMGKDDSQRGISAKDNLKHYGERLAEQNKQQLFDLEDRSGSQNGQGGGGQPNPMQSGFNGVNRGVNVGGIHPQGEFDMDQALPTGLTSLDIDLPVNAAHYEEFLFTTLRGNLTITARPVSGESPRDSPAWLGSRQSPCSPGCSRGTASPTRSQNWHAGSHHDLPNRSGPRIACLSPVCRT